MLWLFLKAYFNLTLSKCILDNFSQLPEIVSLLFSHFYLIVNRQIRNVHSDNAIGIFTFLKLMRSGLLFFLIKCSIHTRIVGSVVVMRFPKFKKMSWSHLFLCQVWLQSFSASFVVWEIYESVSITAWVLYLRQLNTGCR